MLFGNVAFARPLYFTSKTCTCSYCLTKCSVLRSVTAYDLCSAVTPLTQTVKNARIAKALTAWPQCLNFTAKDSGGRIVWQLLSSRTGNLGWRSRIGAKSQKLDELLTQGVADGDARAEPLKPVVRKIVEESAPSIVDLTPVSDRVFMRHAANAAARAATGV